MRIDRRQFLRIAGLTAVGLPLTPAIEAFSRAGSPEPSPPFTQNWGMAVDLRRCWQKEGCRECIDACHRVHNVPDLGSAKEEVKWIWEVPFERALPDHEQELSEAAYRGRPAIVLCNHCENPPCIKFCPTKATWKRADGIVMMDFHRCIGCRYCMAGCPYGSRSFNWRDPRPFIKKMNPDFPTRTRGVVEKCNFCEERLAQGMLPACVEACKEKALVFGDLKDPGSSVRKVLLKKNILQRQPELGTRPKVYYIV